MAENGNVESSQGTDGSRSSGWTLCLGPGGDLADLGPVLAHLGRGVNGPVEVRVRAVADVADLLGELPDRGRLVLFGDGFPEEDIGFVRRFLANNPFWELVLLGRDPGARAARVLLALDRSRWLAFPPDLEQLRELIRCPLVPAPPPWERSREESGSAREASPGPGLLDAEAPAPDGATEPSRPGSAAAPGESPAAPAPAYEPPTRSHVAALADIAQRLELSLGAARARGAGGAAGLEEPASEVGRLRRFTRMLGHVTSPPERGNEEFDVGELFEERLAETTVDSPSTLRFLPKGQRGHVVRADRAAVGDAIGCVLSLARSCAAPDGVVKAPYRSERPGQVTLVVDFPEGPLAGADPGDLLDPGAHGRIADHLPDYGPADLPAAVSLARSQGGDLRVRRAARGRLVAELSLPLTGSNGAQGPAQE